MKFAKIGRNNNLKNKYMHIPRIILILETGLIFKLPEHRNQGRTLDHKLISPAEWICGSHSHRTAEIKTTYSAF
jgi:hypothetical protein